MCKVSVIIPYYNRENVLIRALDSVIVQTFKDYEIILIDDGSTDNSSFIVEEYVKKHKEVRIVNLHQENRGAAAARNTGIKYSRGEYVAFLDSDDSWNKNKLEVQMRNIYKYDIDFICSNLNIVYGDTIYKKYCTKKSIEKIDFKKTLFKYYSYTPTVIMRKSIMYDIGFFPENLKIGEDMYVFQRCIRKYNCYIIGEFLTNLYKPIYGVSGLTKDMKLGQKAIVDNLKIMRKENCLYDKKINSIEYSLAFCFSYIKYIRRIIIYILQQKRKTC